MSTSASSEQDFRLPRNQRQLHRQYAQEMGVDTEDIEVKVIGVAAEPEPEPEPEPEQATAQEAEPMGWEQVEAPGPEGEAPAADVEMGEEPQQQPVAEQAAQDEEENHARVKIQWGGGN